MGPQTWHADMAGGVQIRGMCESAQEFLQLVGHGESDAWLSLGLAFYLSIIPLSLQLANISGAPTAVKQSQQQSFMIG